MTVRLMSKMRSTGNKIAIHAGFKPMALSTITSITKPALGMAADPTEAKVAVTVIIKY